MALRPTLENWIARVITDPSAESPCSAIALVHMQGLVEDEVHVLKLAPGSSHEPRKLSDMFRNMAEEHAIDLSGAQTYKLLAFYGGSSEAQAKRPFVVQGRYGEDGITEAPTREGKLQQDMRLTEAIVQGAFRERAVVMSTQQQIIEMLSKHLQTVSAENIDAVQAVKEMILQKATDDREARQKELEYSRATDERRRFLALIPPVANQVLGREVFPQATADTALIDSIADSITEEQFTQIASILRPEQQALLAGRLTKALSDKRKAYEEESARSNEIEDDAKDAAQ